MGKLEVRLGTKMVLDSEKERDLIITAEKLNNQRKMSELMTSLYRIACDRTGELKEMASDEDFNNVIRVLNSVGISKDRKEFFQGFEAQVHDMKSKVDAIYDIAFKTYSLAQVNKMNGIEGKSENIAMAQFALQKQLNDIASIVGCSLGTYESGKTLDMKKRADSVLEYIIETYDGIGDALGISSVNSSVTSAESDKKVEELKEQINKLGLRYDLIRREKDELQEENEALRTSKAELEQQIADIKKKNTELRNQITIGGSGRNDDLEAELNRLQKKLTDYKEEVEDLEEENSRLKRRLKRREEDDNTVVSSGADTNNTEETTVKESAPTHSRIESDESEPNIDFGSTADIAALNVLFGEA